MDIIDIFGFIYTAISYLIFLPVLVYHLRQFNQHSDDAIIASRDKIFVYMINILTLVALLIERQLQLGYRVWLILNPATIWITYITAITVLGGSFILFAIKVYHLNFQQRYNSSIADQLWRHTINPNDTNWYITHKFTFGSTIYLIKLALIPFCILIIIELVQVFTIGEGPLFVLIHVIVVLTPTITSVILYVKLKHFEDAYGIKNEIFYQFIVLIIGLFAYIFTNIIFSNLIHNSRLYWLCNVYNVMFLTAPVAFSSSYYPLHLIKQRQLSKHASLSAISLSGQDSLCKKKSKKGFSIIKAMNEVMAEYNSFKKYMLHLVHEFCAENLLFLVELIQIKYEYQVKNKNLIRLPKETTKLISLREEQIIDDTKDIPQLQPKTSSLKKKDNTLYQVIDFNIKPSDKMSDKFHTYLFHDDGSIMSPIYLSPKLPQTILISEHENSLFEQMKGLYNKYVRISSVSELNISYTLRESLMHYFEGVNEEKDYKVFNIMDDVAIEVLKLLQDSFRRFRLSDEYKETHVHNDNAKDKEEKLQTDLAMKELLNSKKMPVLRNATSYSVLQEQYSIK